MPETYGKLTLICLTPIGKSKHEDLTIPAPYNSVTAVLYDAGSNGASLDDVCNQTGLGKEEAKRRLNILHRNKYIKVSAGESAKDVQTLRM